MTLPCCLLVFLLLLQVTWRSESVRLGGKGIRGRTRWVRARGNSRGEEK